MSLQIPVYPQMNESDIKYIAAVLNQALQKGFVRLLVYG